MLKAYNRMDGAALLSVQIAQDKAYIAGFGLSTDGWHEFIKNDPPLADGRDSPATFLPKSPKSDP